MGHHKVIIVGAGIAGCNAARVLTENGVNDVIILEATDRVGGRAKTVSTNYGYFEFGAQWIHGDEGNPLYKLLSELNLLDYRGEHLYDDEYVANMNFYRPNGQQIKRSSVIDGFNIYDTVSDRIHDMWKPDLCPIEDFKIEHFDQLCEELSISPDQKLLFKALTEFEDKASGYSEAIYPNDRSYLITEDLFDDCGGKNYVFRKGASSIITHLLLSKIQDKILLNTEVVSVNYGGSGQSVVKTRNSGTFTADYIVMTASLGFIKKNHPKLFVPPLPSNMTETLNSMQFGKCEKFCFLFDDIFWSKELAANPGFSGLGFLYLEDEISELKESLAVILGREATWWKAIACLTTCTTNPNILILWLAGEACVQANKCSDETLKEVVFTIIQYFTKIQVNHPCTLIRTNWAGDKYFLGSYTAITKDHKREYSETMLAPVTNAAGKPMVLFAGEAYHPTLMSSLPGAYESGEIQAMKIIDYERTTK